MLISSNPIMTAIRSIFVVTDVGIYALLRFMYELFFNIATFNVVDREMIFNIISRVQLIVGVYMMFQLILIIIRGIINPDSFTDSKTGAGNLIMRIIVSLSLLALIVPINIPSPKNEYEKQINNSGILFGTLYSLQYRILTNNTLGRIILGQEGTNYTSNNPDGQYLVTFGNRFVSVIAKSFYSIYRDESGDSVCDDKSVEEYNNPNIWPEQVIILGLKHCKGKYFLNMTMLISSVAGIVLVVIMFMMCFEVAKRVFQLAALQLLAPIPIISYMDPKGSKDGAFSSWVKLLSKTYLDLFTRLTVIYFTLAVIEGFINKFFSNMVESNLNTWQGDAIAAYELNRWTFIILCIALFIFAKDAPKFFKQMLGLKGDGKFFDAFGQAMGLGTAAVGAIGSARAGYQSSKKADETRQSLGMKDHNGNVIDPNSGFNKAKHALAGIMGGATGLATGAGAALNAKDHNARAAWEAMQRKNQAAMARGSDGSTLLGRLGSTARGVFMGEGSSADIERQIATNKSRIDALKAIQSRVKGEMVKKDWTESVVGKKDKNTGAWTYFMQGIDQNGNVVTVDGAINYKDFMARKNAAASAGVNQFEIKTTHGNVTISMEDANRYEGLIMKGNEDNYIQQQINHTTTDVDNRFITLVRNADNLGGPDGGSSDFERDPQTGEIKKGKNKKIEDRDSIWEAIEAFEDYNVQLSQQNAVNKANDQYSGNKK